MPYGEDRDPIPAIPEPTVIFIINPGKYAFPEHPDPIDVYNRTRRAWVIGPEARDRAVYALGVRNGVVLGAYRIEWWQPAPPAPNRWEFQGHTATELAHVVGTSIERIKHPQGASNPVRLYLNGIPDGSNGNAK
jgi:hypothetical protein